MSRIFKINIIVLILSIFISCSAQKELYTHKLPQENECIYLVKDVFGIKPLYYTKVNDMFLVSSEIKGLLGSKIIYIETFANSTSKSKTGKLVYKFADLFIVQWESMKELYPDSVVGGWIF